MNYESLFNRSVAIAIDDAIWFVPVIYIFSLLPISLQNDATFVVVYFFAAASLWFNYFPFCEWRWGRTVGKHVMGMKVVAADGSEIGFGPASVRGLLRLVDFFAIGEIMIAASERRQRLGDKLADTVVVRTRAERRPAARPKPAAPAAAPVPAPRSPAPASAAAQGSVGSLYASAWGRFAAFLIDWMLFMFVFLIALGAVVGDSSNSSDYDPAASWVVVGGVIAYFFYFALCEWRFGRTLGKRLIGLRVEPADGGRIRFASALWRSLLQLVDVWVVGPAMIASSERHQRVGDLAAGTVVVRARGEHAPVAPPVPVPAATPEPSQPDASGESTEKRKGFPWVTWGAADAFKGLFAGLLLAAIAAPLLVVPFDPDFSSLGATLAAQALLTVALIGTAFYMAGARGRSQLRAAAARLGWRPFKPSAFALALGTLFVYFVAVAIYISVFGEPEQTDVGADLGLGQGVVAAIAAIGLIAIAAPIAEESFFRGFFYGGLRTRLPTIPSALISGLVFGAVHATEGPTVVVPLAILGTALALLYERSGSLWPCIFAHCVNNSLALAVG